MNSQLVDTLAQIINALTPEEKALLQEKTSTSQKNQEAYQKMVEVRDKIFARREGKPFDMDVNEIIYQMREERSQELMDACFPNLSQLKSNIKE